MVVKELPGTIAVSLITSNEIVICDKREDRNRITLPGNRIFCGLLRSEHTFHRHAFSVASSFHSLTMSILFHSTFFLFPLLLCPRFTRYVATFKESLVRENACDSLHEKLPLIKRTQREIAV